jgi:hypothetical protein
MGVCCELASAEPGWAEESSFAPYSSDENRKKNQPRRSGAEVLLRRFEPRLYLPAPPVDVPAPPLGFMLDPARPLGLLLGLLVPAAPGVADGECMLPPAGAD